jgi:hypothetical protein
VLGAGRFIASSIALMGYLAAHLIDTTAFPRTSHSAAHSRFKIKHKSSRRQPQPIEQRAWRYQHVVAARDALEFQEVAGAKVLNPSGIEGHHRPRYADRAGAKPET